MTKFLMISSATRMDGFYEAYSEDPENENVKTTLENKVVRVLVFSENTPIDVLEYLKDLHNKLNQAPAPFARSPSDPPCVTFFSLLGFGGALARRCLFQTRSHRP